MQRFRTHRRIGSGISIVPSVILLLSLIVTACQGPQPLPVEKDIVQVENLYANPWVLVAYGDPQNPSVLPKNTIITATFTPDSQLSGNAGCNQYQTTFKASAQGEMTMEPAATTRMACPEELMTIEQAYLQALETAESFNFSPEGRLVISYLSGEETANLVFAVAQVSLVDTAWTLAFYGEAANPQPVPAGLTITAQFGADGMVSGSAGCNNYTAAYTAAEGQITIEPPASTMMMCPTGMQEESIYLVGLSQAQSYAITGTTLTLTLENEQVLVYTSLNLPLEKTLWTLVDAAGLPIPPELTVTAFFEPGNPAGSGIVSGASGCNQYSGSYQAAEFALTVSELISTMMMCDEQAMEIEQAYVQALGSSQTFEIAGANLMISTEMGVLTFNASRTPLTGALWVLTALGDINQPQAPVTGSKFTAQFIRSPLAPTGVLTGTTGCNEYAGSYASSLTEIKINLPTSTQNATCVPGLVDQEQLYFLALNSATTYQIIGNTLVIPYDDGKQALIYTATQVGVARFQPLINLDGTSWYLWSINDQPVVPGSTITAEFTVQADGFGGKINGSAGCNLYQAEFGEGLGVQTSLNSQQVCNSPAGLMDQETNYLQALSRTFGYWLTGDQLILNTGLGSLTFRTIPPAQSSDQTYLLQANRWFLVFYNTVISTPGADGDPNLIFNPDFTVTGYTGCNNLQGRYTTNLNQLTISDLALTKAACTNSVLTNQEKIMLDILNTAQTYQVIDTSMQIIGAQGVLNFYITPVNQPGTVVPPTATITSPDTGEVGKKIVFDASASTSAVAITRVQWDFGDGGRGEGKVVEYKYSKPGSFLVQMTVTDKRGFRDSDSKTVVIVSPDQPVTPTATTTTPPTAAPTQTVQPPAEPTATTQPPVEPTATTQPPVEPTATSQPPEATATSEPTLAPEATPTATLEPAPTEPPQAVPPVAAVQGPGNGFPGEPVFFDASGSQAGSSPIVSYAWNFGDGTSAQPGSSPTTAVIYNRAGSYTVTVTVTDQNGLTSSASTQVGIQARLEGPVWVLSTINNQRTVPGTSVTLQFHRGQLAGFAGCNSYTGSYSATDNGDGTYAVTVTGVNSTKLACPNEVMQQESTYLNLLGSVQSAQAQGSGIILISPNGTLSFVELGSPTPK